MRKLATCLAVITLFGCSAVWAAEQNPQLEVREYRPSHEVSNAIAAGMFNVVYVPVRFAVTSVMAGLGGTLGWLNGGDCRSAKAIWENTDGQAYITPRMLERHERVRFGRMN